MTTTATGKHLSLTEGFAVNAARRPDLVVTYGGKEGIFLDRVSFDQAVERIRMLQRTAREQHAEGVRLCKVANDNGAAALQLKTWGERWEAEARRISKEAAEGLGKLSADLAAYKQAYSEQLNIARALGERVEHLLLALGQDGSGVTIENIVNIPPPQPMRRKIVRDANGEISEFIDSPEE